jgi:hypothetical protein
LKLFCLEVRNKERKGECENMIEKILKLIFGRKKHGYYKHSSSDFKHGFSKKHQHYGYKHYKKKHKKSFFSSSHGFFKS